MKITESQFKEILAEEIKKMLEAQEINERQLDEIGFGLRQLGKKIRGPSRAVRAAQGGALGLGPQTATQQASKIIKIHFTRLVKGLKSFVADAKKLGHDENSNVIGKEITEAKEKIEEWEKALVRFSDPAAITAAQEDRPEHTTTAGLARAGYEVGEKFDKTGKPLTSEAWKACKEGRPAGCWEQFGAEAPTEVAPAQTPRSDAQRRVAAEQQSREVA